MEIVEGPNGTVQEVRNIWRFDEMFSASVVMDYDKNSDLKLDKDELAEIGNTVPNRSPNIPTTPSSPPMENRWNLGSPRPFTWTIRISRS